MLDRISAFDGKTRDKQDFWKRLIQDGKPWLSVCLIFFIVPGLAPTYVEKAKFSLAGTDDLSRICQEVLRGVNGRRFVENISPEFIRFLIDAYTVM